MWNLCEKSFEITKDLDCLIQYAMSMILLGVLMKTLITALSAILCLTVGVSAYASPDTMSVLGVDYDAFGRPLDNNKEALQKMDFKATLAQANKGDSMAQLFVAKMYADGIHTKADPKKAVEYYQMSANNGNARAMNNLAVLYMDGESVKQDKQRAIQLWTSASSQNQPVAMVNLASHKIYGALFSGEGLNPSDYHDGVALLEKAGKLGYAPAYDALAEIFDDPKRLDLKMAHENGTLSEADKKALDDLTGQVEAKQFEYLQKSADMGFAPAQMALSDYYQMTYVMNVDKSIRPMGMIKSYEWASRACINGVERGCQTVAYWGGIKTADLSEDRAKCKAGDNDSCESVKVYEMVQKQMAEIDKKFVSPPSSFKP